jgi:hypothetical protein
MNFEPKFNLILLFVEKCYHPLFLKFCSIFLHLITLISLYFE